MSEYLSPLQRLQALIHIEYQDIGTLLAYGIGIGVLSLATPVAVQALVNTIAFGALFQPLLVLMLVLLGLLVFSNTLAALQFYVVEMLQRRLFVRVFTDTAQRLQQASIHVHDEHHLPELSNRFFDVVVLQKTAAVLLLETLGYVLQTLIGMLLLAFYHPILLAFDLFLIAMLAIILFVLGKNGVNTAIAQSKAKYAAAAWLETIASNPLLGQTASSSAFLNAQTERIAHDYLQTGIRHFRVLARQHIGALVLHALANTLLLGLGGWMVIERQLSLGQLIAAELVVSAMIYGLTRLGKTLDNFYELLTSLDKLGHLQDLPQQTNQGATPAPAEQPYQVNIHQLALPNSLQLDQLQGLDLQLRAGEKLVISDGAERGSLLDLLFGIRNPCSGYLYLDGQDLRDLNLQQLRNNISLVRHAEIIPDSVLDNLCLGRDMALSEVRQVLIKVGLQDEIAALPAGLNTTLSINGAPLTSEQCLRLTLARALLGRPRLLLLDYVLDRIDIRVLPLLLDCLVDDTAPWTLIITSHQAPILARIPRHGRIDQGRWHEIKTGESGAIL